MGAAPALSRLTIERRVGRLVEARFAGNPDEADVARWARETMACLQTCLAETGKAAICCTDVRPSALFRPAATEQLVNLMRGDASAVARNGVLCTGGATFTLQLQRLFREAATSDRRRRVFTDIPAVVAWLDEVLTPPERLRVREFIAEFDPLAAALSGVFGGFTAR